MPDELLIEFRMERTVIGVYTMTVTDAQDIAEAERALEDDTLDTWVVEHNDEYQYHWIADLNHVDTGDPEMTEVKS